VVLLRWKLVEVDRIGLNAGWPFLALWGRWNDPNGLDGC